MSARVGNPLGTAAITGAGLVVLVHLVATYVAAAALAVPACGFPVDTEKLVSQYLYDKSLATTEGVNSLTHE